jgi:hypothetical protein
MTQADRPRHLGSNRCCLDAPRMNDSVGELVRGQISRKTLLKYSGRGMRAPTRDQTNPGAKISKTQSQQWIGRGAYPAPAIYAIVV